MSRIIDVAGTKLSIPEGYLPMQPMPDDPPGSLPLGMEGPSAMCFLMVFPIPHEQAMPYDDPDEVIEGIHCSLAQDQGLVEVNTPATAKGKRVIYSVVKTAVQPAAPSTRSRSTSSARCTTSASRASSMRPGRRACAMPPSSL